MTDQYSKSIGETQYLLVFKYNYTYCGPEDSMYCNLRKHIQMDKTQAHKENIFINLTTLVQHYENALQIQRTVNITETCCQII